MAAPRWVVTAAVAVAGLGVAFGAGYYVRVLVGGDGTGTAATAAPATPATSSSTSLPPAASTSTVSPPPPGTLGRIEERGVLNCGVNTHLPGFAERLDTGDWIGFDVDYCRAVAVAVLGDPTAVAFFPLTAAERFDALRDGTIDVLFRNSTWTQGQDARGLDFGPTIFHDGQQLLGRASLFGEGSTIADLDGRSVCVTVRTTSADNIVEKARREGAQVAIVEAQTLDEARLKFAAGECDAVTGDGSALFVARFTAEPQDGAWVIFPAKPFSYEPLGPVYRADDSSWADAVNWTVYATIIADEEGISRSSVVDVAGDPAADDQLRRLLGGEGEQQTAMGLDADAFLRVVRELGSYGEIFDRNLGPIGIVREGTLNAGREGFGLITSPPAR